VTKEERDKLQVRIDACGEKRRNGDKPHVMEEMLLAQALDRALPEIPTLGGVAGGALAALLGAVVHRLNNIGPLRFVVVDGHEGEDPGDHPDSCLQVPPWLIEQVMTQRSTKWIADNAFKEMKEKGEL